MQHGHTMRTCNDRNMVHSMLMLCTMMTQHGKPAAMCCPPLSAWVWMLLRAMTLLL
jgi:hypothetical protein